jgi:hypothetical protein
MKLLMVTPDPPDGVRPLNPKDILLELTNVAAGNEMTPLLGMVPFMRFEELLSGPRRYDVVHFAMHGDYSVLQFSDGTTTIESLVRALKRQRSLRLCFLNACNTASTAARINNDLGCAVIANEAPINSELAALYATEFYRAVAAEASFEDAETAAWNTMDILAKRRGMTQDNLRPIFLASRNRESESIGKHMSDGLEVSVGRLTNMTDAMQQQLANMAADVRVMQNTVSDLKTTVNEQGKSLSDIQLSLSKSAQPPATWPWLVMGLGVLMMVIAIIMLLNLEKAAS